MDSGEPPSAPGDEPKERTDGGPESGGDPSDTDVERRVVVRLAGAALFLGSAGCLDSGNGADEEEAPSAPPIDVTDAWMSETTVFVGEPLEVTGRVENEGDRAGRFYAELRIDGAIVDTEEMTIGGGDVATVTFTHSFDEPNEHEVSVNDAIAGVVSVEPPPEFEIKETTVDRTMIMAGEAVDVAATVANVGGHAGTFEAELERDGEVVATQAVRIAPEETTTVRFSIGFEERGAYDLSVNGVAVDTVYVKECFIADDETITVDGRTSETYRYDLKEGAEVTVTAVTESGVDPVLTGVGPSGESLFEEVSSDSIHGSFTADEPGSHELRFENPAVLPWRDGTWAIEIEICTW